MDNILTMALDGEITLAEFSEALRDFRALIAALSQEIRGKTKIDWRIDDLNAGSAMTTIRGVSLNTEVVEGVIRAYTAVGSALQRRTPIPYSERVRQSALRLRGRVKGSI